MNNLQTENFGVHLLFDAYGCNPTVLKDREVLTKFLYNTPKAMNMHTISEPVVVEVGPQNQKDPGGISGFVMIAESHISFHTFPDKGFVTADIYTCQNDLDVEGFTKLLVDLFETDDYDTQIVKRGVRYPA